MPQVAETVALPPSQAGLDCVFIHIECVIPGAHIQIYEPDTFPPAFLLTRYDDMLPAYGTTRSDNMLVLAFTVLNRRLDYHGFTPRFSYIFSEQHSNIPVYSFTRNQFRIGLTSLF